MSVSTDPKGWVTAQKWVEEKCRGKPKLAGHVLWLMRRSGVQGSAGLIYLAACLLRDLGHNKLPPVSYGLKFREAERIRERAWDLSQVWPEVPEEEA